MKRIVSALLVTLMSSSFLIVAEKESLPEKYVAKEPTEAISLEDQFFAAVTKGDLEAAKALVVKIGPNIKDAKGNTPLHYANNLKMVQFLVDNDANVDAQNNEGLAPLHVQVVMGRPKIVRYLLEHNTDANIKTKTAVTPLHLSTMIAFFADRQKLHAVLAEGIVGELVGGGAGFAIAIAAGLGATGFAAVPAAGASAVTVGLIAQVDIRVRNSIMLLLLKHGARVNAKDADGNTPLHTLADGQIVKTQEKLRRGGRTMAEQLLMWGADQNIDLRTIQNNAGMTPYDVAMKNGRLLLARLLDPRLPRPFEKMGSGLRKSIGTAAPMPTEPTEPEPKNPQAGEHEKNKWQLQIKKIDIGTGVGRKIKPLIKLPAPTTPAKPEEPKSQEPQAGEEEGTVDIDMGMQETLKRQKEKQQLVTD